MAWLDYDGLLYFWQKIKAKLADKVDKVEGKGLSSNDFTTAEKNKLAGIAAGANNYSHPTSSGNKHIPSGGSAGLRHRLRHRFEQGRGRTGNHEHG